MTKIPPSTNGRPVVSPWAVRAFSKAEKARFATLLPQVRNAFMAVRIELASAGIQTFIGSCYRSKVEQAQKFAARLSDTKERSWHELRRSGHLCAFVGGLPDINAKDEALVRKIHAVAKRHGFTGIAFKADGSKKYLKSGGWDAHHFEFREGMTWAQAARQKPVIA